MKIFGRSQKPLKYSSAPTRATSMQGFMQGAEIDEKYDKPSKFFGEQSNDYWALNIRSGCNRTDIPSRFGFSQRGMEKIGGRVFDQGSIIQGWKRVKGEPTDI